MIYSKKHHFLNPYAYSELQLFSLSQLYVKKIDSYGLIERFWVPAEFGYICLAEMHTPNQVKIINLRDDFNIPQNRKICLTFSMAFNNELSPIERNRYLKGLHNISKLYVSPRGRKEFREETDIYFDGDHHKHSTKLRRIASIFAKEAADSYSAWDRFRDEMKIHNHFNFPLTSVLSLNMEFMKKIFKMHGYRPLYYPKGYDPINIALMINDIDLLDNLVVCLQDDAKNTDYFLAGLNLEKFRKIMNCSSNSLKSFVLEACLKEPSVCKAEMIHSYPLPEGTNFKAFPMLGLSFNAELRQRIDQEIQETGEGVDFVKVRCFSFRFSFDDSFFSESVNLILEAFRTMPDEMKTHDFQYIIRHLWNSNYHLICFYSLFVAATSFLFQLYFIWLEDSFWLAVLVILNCFLLLCYELVSLFNDAKEYFESYYNFLDLYIYICRPVVVVMKYNQILNESNEFVNTWINLTLLVAGFRTMGELRIFSSTRVLMAMISKVIYDMIAFVVIVIFMIFLFSIVEANTSKFDEERRVSTLGGFALVMHQYYDVASGNWAESIQGMRVPELVNFYISGIALSILMLNLLISVISLTFDNFLEKNHLYDLEELHEVMIGHSVFFRLFRRARNRLFPCLRKNEWVGRYHHCFLVRDEEDEGDKERQILSLLGKSDQQLELFRETTEASLINMGSRIENIEGVVKSLGASDKGPNADLMDRVKMVEGSVLGLEKKMDRILQILEKRQNQ